jgi:hypothetical protein
MAAIAVGVGVYPHEPVMKARGDFIQPVRAVFDPVAAVIRELPQLLRDAIRVHADILAAAPVRSGPAPNPPQHLFVQSVQEQLVQDIAAAGKGPTFRFQDIGLLGGI